MIEDIAASHGTGQQPGASATGRTRAMTDSQREIHVKQALTRFVRNKTQPEELETLRYNLIRARVANGMTAVEAADKFGYANSTQLSLIESGQRKTPDDWKFLKQAARAYAVSIDWLLGLSPHMEPDSKLAREFALLRGTESLVNAFIGQMATAVIQVARESQPVAEELERVISDLDALKARFDKLAVQETFQDVPGGAPVVAAVERLTAGIAPLRAKLKRFKGIEAYLAEVRAGALPMVRGFEDYLGSRAEVAS
ncbi:helix-turn-helix domain-containing protein [Paraburkholderia ginsengisoli]|uniref:Helix-turn-helix transcriptional regulator n=1 Tax=Paraburkholderia ginsengisoli TaxID=311231 RepID=A0A7T4N214_9BURK|nr:helix-turn-helix transcriptional regulator [Paraburkholderia ginsengisoli]QQC63805.1 helix-turn-helix transcriptional regulator [Paraburkholderia ginsengisoli]